MIRRIEPDVESASARVRLLQEQLEAARQESIKYTADEAKLRSLQREAETNQGLLQTFLERAKETSDRFELESADARLLANAVVPTSPSEPNMASGCRITWRTSSSLMTKWTIIPRARDSSRSASRVATGSAPRRAAMSATEAPSSALPGPSGIQDTRV